MDMDRRTALHVDRDALLKYHDATIERDLATRRREHDALVHRLSSYETSLRQRMERENRNRLAKEEEASMLAAEERRKQEMSEEMERRKRMEEQMMREDVTMQYAVDMMRRCGTIEATTTTTSSSSSTTSSTDTQLTATTSRNDTSRREITLTKRKRTTEPGCGLLSVDLRHYPNAEVIKAASSDLGIAGSLALSRALTKGACRNLQELHLQWNSISDSGVAHLMHACIDHAKKLRHLDLTANHITHVGVERLRSALCAGALPALDQLILRKNPIGDRAAVSLTHMLFEGLWQTIKLLNISSCNINDVGMEALRSGLGSDSLLTNLAPRLERVVARDNRASAQTMLECGDWWPDIVEI